MNIDLTKLPKPSEIKISRSMSSESVTGIEAEYPITECIGFGSDDLLRSAVHHAFDMVDEDETFYPPKFWRVKNTFHTVSGENVGVELILVKKDL